jgi:hypothetical protein
MSRFGGKPRLRGKDMNTAPTTVRSLVALLCTAFALLLGGCGAPVSRGLIGTAPKQLDPAEWNGHWRSEDETYIVRVADAEAGLLEIAEIEEKDNALQLSILRLYVREQGDAMLFNLNDPANPAQTYTFGRFVRRSDTVVFWPTRTDAMEQLIGRGLVTGHVAVKEKTREVTITGGYDQLAGALAAPEGWLLLKLDEPTTFVRTRDSL